MLSRMEFHFFTCLGIKWHLFWNFLPFASSVFIRNSYTTTCLANIKLPSYRGIQQVHKSHSNRLLQPLHFLWWCPILEDPQYWTGFMPPFQWLEFWR